MTRSRFAGLVCLGAAVLGLAAAPGCKKTAQVRDTTPTLPEELDPMLVRFADFPVDEARTGRRPLVIFAMSADEPIVRAQLEAVREARSGFEDRDMALVEVYETGVSRFDRRPMSPESAVAWHARYRASKWPVEVVLVGKDGGVKRRFARGAAMADLFDQIDRMPVRKRELYERGRGGG